MAVRRTFAGRIVLIAMLGAGAIVLFAAPVLAQSNDDGVDRNDQIVLNGRLEIRTGDSVGTAVILNGPARISGTVRETLFVLNGNADIGGTVDNDVIVINGDVTVRGSGHVGGDIVSQSDPTLEDGATVDGSLRRVTTNYDFNGLGFASRFVWWLGYSASTLFLGLLLLLLFPAVDAAIAAAWRDRAGGAIGVGAAMFFLLPVVAVIFLVTIVGIPLGVILLMGLALVYTVGYVAGAHALGRLLVKPPTSRFLAFLAGWAILRGIGLIPVVGGLLWMVASLIGLGLLTVAARRTVARAEPTSPPPPPPPAPVTAPA